MTSSSKRLAKSHTSTIGGGPTNNVYGAAEFLAAHEYTHVQRWAKEIAEREAVKRGRRVNRTWGEESEQVPERHQAADLDKA